MAVYVTFPSLVEIKATKLWGFVRPPADQEVLCSRGEVSKFTRLSIVRHPSTPRFRHGPHVSVDAGFHHWRDAQGLVNSTEVVVHVVNGHRGDVILKLFQDGTR